MELTSPAFREGEIIPVEYSIHGAGVSPPLRISGVPADAASLALVVEDPDLPRSRMPSGMFDHWTVWNIPVDTATIAAGAEPPGNTGLNTYGTHEYVPMAPPTGEEHTYYFYLYALDTRLDLPDSTTKNELYEAMTGHVLAVRTLSGRFAAPGEVAARSDSG